MFRFLGRFIVFAIVIAIIASGYGYSKLEITRTGPVSVTPSFRTDLLSLGSAFFNVMTLDVIGAIESVLEGIQFTGRFEFHNDSFVPLYVPELEHRVYVAGRPTQRTFTTPSFSLAPGSRRPFPFSFLIPTDDLPGLALEALSTGGAIDLGLESSLGLGPLSLTLETNLTGRVQQTIQEQVRRLADPTATPTVATRPRATPTVQPTSTPRPTPTSVPTPTPTLSLLSTPTPRPTPTPTPKPGDIVTSVVVSVEEVTVSHDGDPFLAGAGEIYVVIVVSDGRQLGIGHNASRWVRLNDGEAGAFSVGSGLLAPSGDIDVYMGVWEQDSETCYPPVLDRIVESTTFSESLQIVDGLSACGDDLLGQTTFRLSEQVDNWNSGFDFQAGEVEGLVFTSRSQELIVGTTQISVVFTVVKNTVGAIP